MASDPRVSDPVEPGPEPAGTVAAPGVPAAERAAARAICVLGMHRSGTSLVSRLLHLLGVYLGPQESISNTGEDNPTGYWEHSGFVRLNEELLARLGGRWDAPPALTPGWFADPC